MSNQDKPKELRASIYFSRRKDKDIINEIDFEGLEKGDINWILKELMRDGIKYRKGVYPSNGSFRTPSPYAEPTTVIPNEDTSITREQLLSSPPIIEYSGFDREDDLESMELKVKELDEVDIANKLDNF
jgi:hypothetical protein